MLGKRKPYEKPKIKTIGNPTEHLRKANLALRAESVRIFEGLCESQLALMNRLAENPGHPNAERSARFLEENRRNLLAKIEEWRTDGQLTGLQLKVLDEIEEAIKSNDPKKITRAYTQLTCALKLEKMHGFE